MLPYIRGQSYEDGHFITDDDNLKGQKMKNLHKLRYDELEVMLTFAVIRHDEKNAEEIRDAIRKKTSIGRIIANRGLSNSYKVRTKC